MCEMVDPYTSRSAQVACAADFKKCIENLKRGCEGQIEEPCLVVKLQSTKVPIKRIEQIHSQVGVA